MIDQVGCDIAKEPPIVPKMIIPETIYAGINEFSETAVDAIIPPTIPKQCATITKIIAPLGIKCIFCLIDSGSIGLAPCGKVKNCGPKIYNKNTTNPATTRPTVTANTFFISSILVRVF